MELVGELNLISPATGNPVREKQIADVTDPANPKPLVQVAGDQSPEDSVAQDPAAVPKAYRSVFIWQDGQAA